MKKLTAKRRIWFVIRAVAQFKKKQRHKLNIHKRNLNRSGGSERHLVSLWFGKEISKALCMESPTIPPRKLCLIDNPEETISFLSEKRERDFEVDFSNNSFVIYPKGKRSIPKIKSYIKFSDIGFVSTAVAVVLAADYQRQSELVRAIPPAVNPEKWNEDVFLKLFQIGFFEMIGLSDEASELARTSSDLMTLSLICGKKTEKLEAIDQGILALGRFIDPHQEISEDFAIPLNSVMAEAVTNVTRHAYPEGHNFAFRHINRWWVAGTADRVNRKLTLVFYDQGASIPVTYPKKKLTELIRDFLLAKGLRASATEKPFIDDAIYIEAALLYGATQTNEAFAGRGLPQMKEVLDILGGGRLNIWSRGGLCTYVPGSPMVTNTTAGSIGGTLIEWTVELPRAL